MFRKMDADVDSGDRITHMVELTLTNFVVEHTVLFSAADHLAALLCKSFPSHKTSQIYTFNTGLQLKPTQ